MSKALTTKGTTGNWSQTAFAFLQVLTDPALEAAWKLRSALVSYVHPHLTGSPGVGLLVGGKRLFPNLRGDAVGTIWITPKTSV